MTQDTEFSRLAAERAIYVACAVKAVARPYGKLRQEAMDRAFAAIQSFDRDHPHIRAALTQNAA